MLDHSWSVQCRACQTISDQPSPFSVKATPNLINIAAVNQRKVQTTSDLENIGLYAQYLLWTIIFKYRKSGTVWNKRTGNFLTIRGGITEVSRAFIHESMCLVKNVTKLAAQTISTKFQMRLNRLLLMQHFGVSPEKNIVFRNWVN